MLELNKCKIGLGFEFGQVQGRTMRLDVCHAGQDIPVIPDQNGKAMLGVEVTLPTKILLKFSGKNHDTDTLVDESGNIIGDVAVKIVNVDFDGFELNEIFLHKKITLVTNDARKIVTSYIGFNGCVELDFTESDVFKQYLLCNQ